MADAHALEQPLVGMARYEKGGVLGEGTFGVTHEVVAIKKIRLGKYKEGVNVTALREIKLLKELNHPNIVRLIDVFPHKRNLNLVFEFMETDLEAIIKDRRLHLGPGDVKAYMLMILLAIEACHANWILHRDMKPNNLLIGADGTLKLADFGLARIFGSPERTFTHQVFARWYRAPELLFGSKSYGGGVDMWAIGCVLGELMTRVPLFEGNSDIDQLGKIFAALGTPTDAQWPGMRLLPDFVDFVATAPPPMRARFPGASEDALALLGGLLSYDPNRRLTATQALAHPFFSSQPAATAPHALPRPPRPQAGGPPGRGGVAAGAGPGGGAALGAAAARGGAAGPPDSSAPPAAGAASPGTLRALAQARRSFPPLHAGGEAAPPAGSLTAPRHGNGHGATAMAQQRSSDVSMRGTPQSELPEVPAPMSLGNSGQPGTGATFLSTGGGPLERPAPNTHDLQYLRKRKLELDAAFDDFEEDETPVPAGEDALPMHALGEAEATPMPEEEAWQGVVA